MAKKTADITIHATVTFEDNGTDNLKDQAIEALMEKHDIGPQDFDMEVVGEVRDGDK